MPEPAVSSTLPHVTHSLFPQRVASIVTKPGGVNNVIFMVNELRPLLLILGCPLMTPLLFYTTCFSPSFPSVFLRNWMSVFLPAAVTLLAVAWVRGHPPAGGGPSPSTTSPREGMHPQGSSVANSADSVGLLLHSHQEGSKQSTHGRVQREEDGREGREGERGPF